MNKSTKNLLGGDIKSGLAYYLGIFWSLPLLFFEIFYAFAREFKSGTATLIFVLALPPWFFGIYCFIKACSGKNKNISSILHSLVPVILGCFTFLAFAAILLIHNYIIRR